MGQTLHDWCPSGLVGSTRDVRVAQGRGMGSTAVARAFSHARHLPAQPGHTGGSRRVQSPLWWSWSAACVFERRQMRRTGSMGEGWEGGGLRHAGCGPMQGGLGNRTAAWLALCARSCWCRQYILNAITIAFVAHIALNDTAFSVTALMLCHLRSETAGIIKSLQNHCSKMACNSLCMPGAAAGVIYTLPGGGRLHTSRLRRRCSGACMWPCRELTFTAVERYNNLCFTQREAITGKNNRQHWYKGQMTIISNTRMGNWESLLRRTQSTVPAQRPARSRLPPPRAQPAPR